MSEGERIRNKEGRDGKKREKEGRGDELMELKKGKKKILLCVVFFFLTSRRRHTRASTVSWARRCV